jgi:hypothetical protein
MPEQKQQINEETHDISKTTDILVTGGILILIGTVVVAIIVFLVRGCSESPEHAIRRALSYDSAVHRQVYKNQSIGEVLFGANPERAASYVRNLKKVPLDNCPKDFQEAYKRHIAAWEARNGSLIMSTWNDVLATAKLHDVNDE